MNEIHAFKTRDELFKFLKKNKDILIGQKRKEYKCADAGSYVCYPDSEKADSEKADSQDLLSRETINVKSVINTTNILDSHGDVHIPGLWKKSLKDHKDFYLLKNHGRDFEDVITVNAKASTKKMKWKELGFDFDGETEALIFESEIAKADNAKMFREYALKRVKEHSVGMRYVQLSLCVNSPERAYVEEKQNWDKYIAEVVNREDAENQGYFWAVTEAKVIEGSAVLFGSNPATPTISTKEFEPPTGTRYTVEPPTGTHGNLFSKFNNF